MKVPAPPPNLPKVPDEDTAKDPDFTGEHAGNRVFYIKTEWLRYGTDDKGHGAALVLSGLLLAVALIVAVIGMIGLFSGRDATWIGTLLTWVGNAFLFTAGIAVGKGKATTKSDD
jgi:hypothetical protein